MADMTKAHAVAELAVLLPRGATLHLILRGRQTLRQHAIVDFVVPPTVHVGEYVGAVMGRPYIYSYQGVLLRKGQQAEAVLDDLSVELFGEPQHLTGVWL